MRFLRLIVSDCYCIIRSLVAMLPTPDTLVEIPFAAVKSLEQDYVVVESLAELCIFDVNRMSKEQKKQNGQTHRSTKVVFNNDPRCGLQLTKCDLNVIKPHIISIL